MELYNEDYALTGLDIFSIIGYPVGLCRESDIDSEDYITTHMLNNCLIVLINDMEEIRHWTCIIQDNESFCYFDSFGEKPKNPHMLAKIDRYMNHSLQHDKATTCGRWVGHFIRFYGINEDSYAALFKHCKRPDRYITIVTGDVARFNILRTPNDDPNLIGIWEVR